ncbi:hypothetical protein Patl1_03943 [Pistacia atlantica]|uniref:Uncharacterized protein n=1 Tax=Pistacia atlantica TaxID=434234 RepID=A0ACC1BPR3_9ROSI|nr:hypothetical protein Patl1_03943 [Pistacia atlantica]
MHTLLFFGAVSNMEFSWVEVACSQGKEWQFPSNRFVENSYWELLMRYGEDIFKAAIREVKEETGIDTEFMQILAFRQSHKSFFEKSNLFFLCMLRPSSFDIQKQELEIEAAQWMPFKEYAAQPFVQKTELLKYMNDLCLAKIDNGYAGFSPQATTSIFSDDLGYLYFNSLDLDQLNVDGCSEKK